MICYIIDSQLFELSGDLGTGYITIYLLIINLAEMTYPGTYISLLNSMSLNTKKVITDPLPNFPDCCVSF